MGLVLQLQWQTQPVIGELNASRQLGASLFILQIVANMSQVRLLRGNSLNNSQSPFHVKVSSMRSRSQPVDDQNLTTCQNGIALLWNCVCVRAVGDIANAEPQHLIPGAVQ